MEFGLFFNGYLPGPAAHDPDSEHLMLMREAEYAVLGDRHNWKYAWFGEHHGLTEYSHMSAPYPVMGYVAGRTKQIHVGSAITSFPTSKDHPVRIAERAAMMDHLSEGRFEFGTGRGAGSHEVRTFNGTELTETKAMWDEVIREIPRMWEQKDYEHHGEAFSVPTPHNILPKPYGEGHPPMWVACGNPATYAKAGAMGLGAIAFNFEPIHNLKGRVDAYLEAAENVTDPVGQFQNHNVMMTNAVICLEDREEARAMAKRNLRGYRVTMVNLYHDSMPQSPDAIVWPNARAHAELDDATLDWAIAEGYMLCGNPEEVCEQLQAYQDVGCTQVTFGTPDEGFAHEQVLEMIEVFGQQVIPEFDTDPEHSTTKYRRQAQRRFPTFNNSVDPIVDQATPPEFAISI